MEKHWIKSLLIDEIIRLETLIDSLELIESAQRYYNFIGNIFTQKKLKTLWYDDLSESELREIIGVGKSILSQKQTNQK